MVVGVFYLIPKQFMNQFFEEGKNAFIKPAAVWKELKTGSYLWEDQGFVGEAKIKDIK